MKKMIQFATLALMCGYASGIGIEWGVETLDLGTDETPALATSSTYGTDLGQFVLQLVFVGDGFMTEGNYNTLTRADTGALAKFPEEVPGDVAGSATVNTAGTYVMLLYNNNGGYYSLSSSASEQTAISSASFVISPEDIENTTGFFDYRVSGNVYKGALVPEPSTAALALAGIALLFRRKRA